MLILPLLLRRWLDNSTALRKMTLEGFGERNCRERRSAAERRGLDGPPKAFVLPWGQTANLPSQVGDLLYRCSRQIGNLPHDS